MSSGRFALLGKLGRTGFRIGQSIGLNPLKPWTAYRAAPELPKKSFRDLWKDGNG